MLRRGGRETAERGKGAVPSASETESGDKVVPSSSHDGEDLGTEDRVAELERALAMAKGSRDSLREELEKSENQGQTDRAMIEDLRHQLAKAQQHTATPSSQTPGEHDKEHKYLRSSDEIEDDLLQQNYELRFRIVQLQEELAAQEVSYRNQLKQDNSEGEAELNELRSRLHMTEKESQERLQQLLSLKSSISSLTRVDSQITDSELGEAFSQLANRIREWVIAHYRRSKLNLDNLPMQTIKALTSITPDYESIKGADRLALYQAILSSTLMHIFQEPIIVGLPTTGPLAAIRHSAEVIRSSGADYHKWRRVTIRAMEKGQARHTLDEAKEKILHQLAADIEHLLFTLTSTNLAPTAQTSLIDILKASSDLQRTLALQKAQYDIVYFHVQEGTDVEFDDRKMESINDLDSMIDEDGDTLIERNFFFCVFPCLEKFGDEWGEHPETSNVLMKASVCCSAT